MWPIAAPAAFNAGAQTNQMCDKLPQTYSDFDYRGAVWAQTTQANQQIQVTVTYNAVATFVQVLGFNQVGIVATATAEAGTNAKTYAIFAYGGIGTGNIASFNGGRGMLVPNGTAANNTIVRNNSFGISTTCPSSIVGNTIVSNLLGTIDTNRDGCVLVNNAVR